MSESDNRGSKLLSDLTDAVGRNPLSSALIGVGALWFVGERIWQEAIRPTLERRSGAVEAAVSGMSTVRESANADADDFGLTEIFRKQPLALGAMGVAVGAVLAAALPSTRTETELMGEISDEFKAKAREFAGDQASHAEDAAERALEAATDEAHKQGLTPEALKSAKDSVAAKLERVVEAVSQGSSKRIE